MKNFLVSSSALTKIQGIIIVVIIALGVASAAFYYSSLVTPPIVQYKRTLTIATPEEPTSLDYQQVSKFSEAHDFIFQGTMSFTPDYEHNATEVPDGAQWAQFSETSIVVHYADNAKFSNGDPITAQAMKASMLRYANLSVYGSDYAGIKSIDIIDNQTARIVFTGPQTYVWLDDMPFSYAGLVDVKAAEQVGDAAFGENPVGSGPYQVQQWVRGSQVVLVRNDYYTSYLPFVNNKGPNPYIDQVILQFVPEDQTRLSKILSGEADIIRGVPSDAVAQLTSNPDIVMHSYLIPGIDFIMMNNAVPPLNDTRVRQALNYAVNRTELAQTLDNTVTPCYGYLSPTMLASDPSTESYAASMYAYNPEKAMTLLTDAGWTMGSDGIFYKNGQPLSLTFSVTNDNPAMRRVAPLLQSQFAKVGVQVKIQEFTSSYIRTQTRKWNFQLADRNYIWHDPAGILPYLLDPSTYGNYTYNNPQVNKLLEQDFFGALDPAAKTALYDQVQHLLLNDAPWIPLFVEKDYHAVRKDVQGLIILPPFGTLILNDVKIIAGTSQAIAPPLTLVLTIALFVNFGCIAKRKRTRETSV